MLNRTDIQQMKQNNEKITMLTAYDYPSAKMAEEANVDMILVGDSLGMVVLGYDTTVEVTMNDMIHHGKAVRRGAKETFVVIDMPFMSYHVSLEESIRNARDLFQQTNAQAIKIEGCSDELLELTRRLTEGGIPVVAHLGLTPQTVNVLGGYKVQGKDQEAGEKLLNDAKQLANHGAMALVLECVPQELAEIVTKSLDIPIIGIGAGIYCDGQVLVYHDILQYGIDRHPKFVKTYMDFNTLGQQAIKSYVNDVKELKFPTEEYAFMIDNKKELPK